MPVGRGRSAAQEARGAQVLVDVGQWMPKPPPEMRQFDRCEGVAWSSRGYHASGTEIVRPSARATVKESSPTSTFVMRSPGPGSEVVIPRLEKEDVVLLDQTLDPREFADRKYSR